MEVSCITPCTPFEAAFDFLFVRGNFEKQFPSCWDFINAMETPQNDMWVQAICTCRLMQLLPHPMYGVLLLCEEYPSLVESKDTWYLARECCVSVVDVELLIRVMRIFCPKNQEEVLFDGAWCTSRLYDAKQPQEWYQYGRASACNLAFTRMWWNQDAAPFLESRDMRAAITALALNEQRSLKMKIFSMERKEVLDKKQFKKDIKDMAKKDEGEVQKKIAKTKALRLDKKELETVNEKTDEKLQALRAIIQKVKSTLARSRAAMFDDGIAEIMVNVTLAYPYLTWQLKALVHNRFTMDSTWMIERRLHGFKWFTIAENPMDALTRWALPR